MILCIEADPNNPYKFPNAWSRQWPPQHALPASMQRELIPMILKVLPGIKSVWLAIAVKGAAERITLYW
jgi:hypothetical protein